MKRTCSLPECSEPSRARGFCKRHYSNWYYAESRPPTAPPEVACVECGAPTPTVRVTRKYCSDECRKAAAKRRADSRPSRAKAPAAKECQRCGVEFATVRDARFCPNCHASTHGDSLTTTCDDDDCDRPRRARGLCSMHWKRWARSEGMIPNQPWTPARKARWRARYALTRGAPDAEPFEYREVFDRDDWMCGICRKPVDPTLAYPDPMSASLDHVIPVAQGGRHVSDNAQCAHLFCNVSKGDRVAA